MYITMHALVNVSLGLFVVVVLVFPPLMDRRCVSLSCLCSFFLFFLYFFFLVNLVVVDAGGGCFDGTEQKSDISVIRQISCDKLFSHSHQISPIQPNSAYNSLYYTRYEWQWV